MSLNIPQCIGRHAKRDKDHAAHYVNSADADEACPTAVKRWTFHSSAVQCDSHYLLAFEKWKVEMQMHFLSDKYAPCSKHLV